MQTELWKIIFDPIYSKVEPKTGPDKRTEMVKERVGRNLIYGLIDPTFNCLRYIGKTHKRREIRLAEHIEAAQKGKKSHVYNWIRSLLDHGLSPEIFVLEWVPPGKDWKEAEKANIDYWRNCDDLEFPYLHPPQTAKSETTMINSVDLTNISDGGDQSADCRNQVQGPA